jgi:hypothetical protein
VGAARDVQLCRGGAPSVFGGHCLLGAPHGQPDPGVPVAAACALRLRLLSSHYIDVSWTVPCPVRDFGFFSCCPKQKTRQRDLTLGYGARTLPSMLNLLAPTIIWRVRPRRLCSVCNSFRYLLLNLFV